MDNVATAQHTHTLALYATVPASRHTQITHILSGLCSHPPVPVRERHLLFRPATAASRTAAADEGGGTQNVVDREKARRRAEKEARERGQGRGVVRWVETVETDSLHGGDGAEGQTGSGALDTERMEVDGGEGSARQDATRETRWSCRWYDTPDPNVRTVTARKSEIVDVSEEVTNSQDAVSAAEQQGLRFVTHYIIAGTQFVHNNIVLLLHRTLLPPDMKSSITPFPLSDSRAVDAMKPLDPSGAYVLEARLEILEEEGKAASNELVGRGMKEMTRFKEMMKGCLELRSVERMAMGTRVA